MGFTASHGRTRIGAALAAAAVQLGLAAMVIWGLAARWVAPGARAPNLVTITPSVQPPPPSAPVPDEGAAAPEGRKSEALPVAAPSPPVVLASPRPAATVAAKGVDTSAGATLAGPGSGAGGAARGTGSGEGGTGTGSVAVSSPVRIAGALRDRDYPHAAAGIAGTVAIAFRVRSDGRVDRCTVIGSSGEPLLDDLTCELVEGRFRYRPARDAAGRPVDSMLRTTFTWGTRQRG